MSSADVNTRPDFDKELHAVADYVLNANIASEEAYTTAYWCLLDAVGCALLALRYPECLKLISPMVPQQQYAEGVRVIGTSLRLDPVQAAFANGALIRWLDYNDTWLAAEFAHPSDNLGAILTLGDWISRQNIASGKKPLTIRDILTALIKAYEIQGIYALQNGYNRVGLDHVVLVKLASTALATQMMGGTRQHMLNALSQVWVDGQSLRTYRHAPNTGSRKSWAAGDATSRGVRLAWMSLQGEMGYPSVLTAPKWGFYDVLFQGKPFQFERPFGSYVVENILFKISYPAEFHAQTAVECALQLHPQVRDRLADMQCVRIKTQEAGVRIISKTGPLYNSADRDHCLQYMVAVALIHGSLTADHYSDTVAADPRIDALREKMVVEEDPEFTKDYFDPEKRAIANAIQIEFRDGSSTEWIRVDYPVGHRRRRAEGLPLLQEKFVTQAATRLPKERLAKFLDVALDKERLSLVPVHEFMEWITF